MDNLIVLIGYFTMGLLVGFTIHWLGELYNVPIMGRLYLGLCAAELLFIPPKNPLHQAHAYFRIGIFYSQAPLEFLSSY
jgi:hypothetical protein